VDEGDRTDDANVTGSDLIRERRARKSGGLRAWFSRRARAVGSSLRAYEPPGAEEPADASAEANAETSEALADADATISPAAEDTPPAEVAALAHPGADAEQLANLSADLILGRTRILMLAALDSNGDAMALADRLIEDAVNRGLSVARVDAGSGQPSSELGVSDLAAGTAEFGDVVHKTAQEGLAEVYWGHLPTIDRRSTRPLTLVEALSDIYEIVVVVTGRLGLASNLPVFAGLPCRLVLVSAAAGDPARQQAAAADVASLGYDRVEFIVAPSWQAEVA
jgi:hypothetical protein